MNGQEHSISKRRTFTVVGAINLVRPSSPARCRKRNSDPDNHFLHGSPYRTIPASLSPPSSSRPNHASTRLPRWQFHSSSSPHQTEISSQRSGRIPPLLAQHFASVTWQLFVTANAKLLIFCVFCIIPARHWGNPQCRTRAIHSTFKLTFKKNYQRLPATRPSAVRLVSKEPWELFFLMSEPLIVRGRQLHEKSNSASMETTLLLFFLVRLWYWNIGSEKGSMMDNGLFFEVSSLFCFRSKNPYLVNVSPAYICQNDRKF